MGKQSFLSVTVLLVILGITFTCNATSNDKPSGEFDVRQHIGTSSRYNVYKKAPQHADKLQQQSHFGCSPIHLNLVARHGIRSPTKKRMKELEKFSLQLENLLGSLEHKQPTGVVAEKRSLPSWLRGWKSPWDIIKTAGHLTTEGEEELYFLGKRTRERFPELFTEDYHPDVFVISATQVPRASASAVAFGMGLFYGKGTLGAGKQRAFAVLTDSRANDIHLRFHDTCQTYKEFKKMRKPEVSKMQKPLYDEVALSLHERYNTNFTRDDVSSLWFLCKQEAALLDKVDQACGLFLKEEIELLEWADDLEVQYLKGYGESLNYRMGVPLLQNIMQSMEKALSMQKDPSHSNIVEKARLRFAHAETIIPFSCLLGLFLSPSDLSKIQSEQPLEPPPKPPQERTWRSSRVAPFAANIMLVLHKCPIQVGHAKETKPNKENTEFFVEILHNEEPIPIPACNGSFCRFQVFKDKVAGPHLRHSFESLCITKAVPDNCSASCKLSRFFRSFLPKQASNVDEDQDL